MFLHHSAVVWKGVACLILLLPHVWVQDLHLQGSPEGFQGRQLKRAIRSLLWGWGKAKPDREVQETFPHAESSLQKRALGLCWSCFSPAPSLPARSILVSTFACVCPHAWGTLRLHRCDSKLLASSPLSLTQESPLPLSLPIPSPSLPLTPQQMIRFALTT